MSATFAPYTIIAALQELLRIGRANTPWEPRGPKAGLQRGFLDEFYSKGIPAGGFMPGELETLGSFNVGVINSFLWEKGFDIQLEALGDPCSLYSASVMNVLVHWLNPGTQTTVEYEGTRYPAAKIKRGWTAFSTPQGQDVVQLDTETGDTVWITIPESPLEGFSMVQEAIRVMASKRPSKGGRWGSYAEVIFPMVDLSREEDISYFCGMAFMGIDRTDHAAPFLIAQALNQNKLKMNHLGAHAESAAAMGAMRGLSSVLVIDKPFLVWFTRKGLTLPYFAAYITPEDWQNPGTL